MLVRVFFFESHLFSLKFFRAIEYPLASDLLLCTTSSESPLYKMLKPMETELSDVLVVSTVTVDTCEQISSENSFKIQNEDLSIEVLKAKRHQCPRCWKYTAVHALALCERCQRVLAFS